MLLQHSSALTFTDIPLMIVTTVEQLEELRTSIKDFAVDMEIR